MVLANSIQTPHLFLLPGSLDPACPPANASNHNYTCVNIRSHPLPSAICHLPGQHTPHAPSIRMRSQLHTCRQMHTPPSICQVSTRPTPPPSPLSLWPICPSTASCQCFWHAHVAAW